MTREQKIELVAHNYWKDDSKEIKTLIERLVKESYVKGFKRMLEKAETSNEIIPDAETISRRWVPVEEQLPEPHKKVLAVRKDGEVAIVVWNDNLNCWFNYWTSYQVRNTTHWMPLPMPPVDCESEKNVCDT